MKAFSWDDMSLFAAVARAGSLAGAAGRTGVSIATLSRRMTALEARLGRRLFLHGTSGYAVTGDGRDLLARAERMEAAAAEIDGWRQAGAGPVRVRISAGTWTMEHLAANLPRFRPAKAAWIPEFLHCNLDMDIARREVDIGIRNRRPEQPWLAGRRTGEVHYAVYAAHEGVAGWIGASHDAAQTRSAAWVTAHHGHEIVTSANEPRLAMALAEAGIGRVVLPDFAGDPRPGLVRIGGRIEALTHEEWLVSHHEGRHEPPVRAALEALGTFLTNWDSDA